MTKPQIKAAAGKCYRAILTGEAPSHTEQLEGGWRVRALRSYHRRPIRVAWSPVYTLIAPGGSTPIDGHTSSSSFAHVAFIYLSRLAAQKSASMTRPCPNPQCSNLIDFTEVECTDCFDAKRRDA
jgi:hypothetical protein